MIPRPPRKKRSAIERWVRDTTLGEIVNLLRDAPLERLDAALMVAMGASVATTVRSRWMVGENLIRSSEPSVRVGDDRAAMLALRRLTARLGTHFHSAFDQFEPTTLDVDYFRHGLETGPGRRGAVRRYSARRLLAWMCLRSGANVLRFQHPSSEEVLALVNRIGKERS